jgi:hypothetical protein
MSDLRFPIILVCLLKIYQYHKASLAPFHLLTCFFNAGMPDFLASGQSDTGMNKIPDAGTIPVPE